MNRIPMAALLTTALLATACSTTRAVVPLRPDLEHPERLACEAAGARPSIPPEYVVNRGLATAAQVYAEHDRFAASIRSREGPISGYVVALEGRLFACSNDAAWLREFFSRLPAPE